MVIWLLFLTDVEDGGGTSFPILGMEIGAKKGWMVQFHNSHEGSTARHRDSLHGGMPVLKGEKWLVIFGFESWCIKLPELFQPRLWAQLFHPKYSRFI